MENVPKKNFMRLSLKGKRFDNHAIPLGLLSNLQHLEKLVTDAAKWQFLEHNSNRQRAPRGLTKDVYLQLVNIEEGSAVLSVDLGCEPRPVASLLDLSPADDHMKYYESGRDAIYHTVAAAAEQTPATNGEQLPDKLLHHFNKIGLGLRDGEELAFDTGHSDRPARLTKDVRRKILLRDTYAQELSEEVTLRGIVPEADQEKMSFDFQIISGPRVTAPLKEEYADAIMEAFNGYKHKKKILINGIGRYNRSHKLLGISSVDQVSVIDDLDPGVQLDELRGLKNGWHDGAGSAPDHRGLDWLSHAFDDCYPDEHPHPRLYPTPAGGVLAEWNVGAWDLSLEINLKERGGYWHALNLSSDAEEEQELNLTKASSWQWLVRQIADKQVGQDGK